MARKAAVMEVEVEAVDDVEVEDVAVADEVVAEVDLFVFDEEVCRQRAYEISESEYAGTPEENWLRAEAELQAAQPA